MAFDRQVYGSKSISLYEILWDRTCHTIKAYRAFSSAFVDCELNTSL